MTLRLLVEEVGHVHLEPQPLGATHSELLAEHQVRAVEHVRAAHVATAVHQQVGAVGRGHQRGHGRAAGRVEERADLCAGREVVRAIHLQGVWTIRRQPAQDVEVAARVPEQFVRIPYAVHVAARAGNAAPLLLRCGGTAAGRRRCHFIRGGQAGVVAIETAQGVVRAEEVVAREPPVVAQLERVVLALRTRNREPGRRCTRRELRRGETFPGVADDVALVTVGVEEADVLDRLQQIVVDVVHRDHAVAAHLELAAGAEARLLHRLGVRIDVAAERRDAAIAAATGVGEPDVVARHVAQVDRSEVEIVQAAVEGAPGLGAERSARQLELGPVVVEAPAAEHFHRAVTLDVERRAETGGELLAKPEFERVLEVIRAERRHFLVLGAETEVEGESVAHRPLVLEIERVDVVARLVGDAAIVHLVVAVGAGAGLAGERERTAPEDVDVTARVVRVDVVDRVLVAVAALQRVIAATRERVVVVDVEGVALGGVKRGDLRARGVHETARALQRRRDDGVDRIRGVAVGVRGHLRHAHVRVAVVELAALEADERGVGQRHVSRAADVDLVDFVTAIDIRRRTGYVAVEHVRGRTVVGDERAAGVGGRPQGGHAGIHAAARERELAEGLLTPDAAVDVAGAVAEVVGVGPLLVPRRVGAVEEEAIAHNRAADRAAHFVGLVRLLLVLHVEAGDLGLRIEHEPLHGGGRERAALEVVVGFSAEGVAAALGDRADDAAEGPAVLGRNAAGLDLHFLQVFEHRVLARLAVDQRVGDDAVHGERVLGAAGAVHLEAALHFTLADGRRAEGDRLEGTALRQAVELLGADVVANQRAAGVHQWGGLADHLHGFRLRADPQLRVDLELAAELNENVVPFGRGEAAQFEPDGVATGSQVRGAEHAVRPGDEHAGLSGHGVDSRNGDAGDYGALLVGYFPGQRAESLLRRREARNGQRKRQQKAGYTCVHRLSLLRNELRCVLCYLDLPTRVGKGVPAWAARPIACVSVGYVPETPGSG